MVAGHGISREQFERDALRLLCSELIQPATRVQLTGLVKDSAFRTELNRVVYEEIAAVGAVPTRRLRELLPGRVTLRGFPDFDLREFLGRDGAKDDDIDRWFESLLELTEEPPEEGKKAMGQSA
jgi:hypothetical protein